MWHALRRIVNRVRYRRFEAEIAEELDHHRTLKARELAASGSAPRADEVRRAMGNEMRMRETAREVWVAPAAEAVGQDVRDAWRLLIRRPLLSAAAIAALMAGVNLGIVPRIEPLSDRIRESLVTERLLALLGALLAIGALLLAISGLFGLMAHVVARRTREIGVRLALGARPGLMLVRVLVEALALGALGLIVGMVAAAAAARWIGGVLYGITPRDPLAYTAVIVTTLLLVCVAGLVPARRAASIDPIAALRAD